MVEMTRPHRWWKDLGHQYPTLKLWLEVMTLVMLILIYFELMSI
jgi:hypothetical protein